MRVLLLQKSCAAAVDGTWDIKIIVYTRQELGEIAWSTIFLHLLDSVIRKIGETTTVESL